MQYTVKGNRNDWEVVIGLEVHCQVISNAKLFSDASAASGGTPNDTVSYIDAGFPGMLPVVNEFCVHQAIKTGLGLNAKINKKSIFARKNYFYADLPQGYQISQYDKPIVGNGYLDIALEDGSIKRVGIERLHLEQDAGKSIHDLIPGKSCVDLNRSGVALMEIVSKPDMRSPYEAGAYMTKLRAMVRWLGVCDGNMDEGSMRCDANVSVCPVNSGELRTRCEIKNINSVRYLMHAIEYEAHRQVEIYESGGKVEQETRLFDPNAKETRSMRGKENANDYRYFPDPDLSAPLTLSDELIAQVRAEMPEMPDEARERFIKQYGIPADDASRLVSERAMADYFENAMKVKGADSKKAANLILVELAALLSERKLLITETNVKPEYIGTLTALENSGEINLRTAKELIVMIADSGKDPETLIAEKGLKQVSDTGAIEKLIDSVISAHPNEVAQFKAGKDKLMGFFVGQVMKETHGKANPGVINKILKEKLK